MIFMIGLSRLVTDQHDGKTIDGLKAILLLQQYVLRFQIAVNQPSLVEEAQSIQ